MFIAKVINETVMHVTYFINRKWWALFEKSKHTNYHIWFWQSVNLVKGMDHLHNHGSSSRPVFQNCVGPPWFRIPSGITRWTWSIYFAHFSAVRVFQKAWIPFTRSSFFFGFTTLLRYVFMADQIFSMGLRSGVEAGVTITFSRIPFSSIQCFVDLLVCFLSLSLEKKRCSFYIFWYLYWTVSADFKFCIIYKHMFISKVLLICILLKYEPNIKYKRKLVTLVCFTNVKQKGKQIKSINWYFLD